MLKNTNNIKPHKHKQTITHLTLSKHKKIQTGLSTKINIHTITTTLNHNPSTISHKIQHNQNKHYYKTINTNNQTNKITKKPKPYLLNQNLPLQKLILKKLKIK